MPELQNATTMPFAAANAEKNKAKQGIRNKKRGRKVISKSDEQNSRK